MKVRAEAFQIAQAADRVAFEAGLPHPPHGIQMLGELSLDLMHGRGELARLRCKQHVDAIGQHNERVELKVAARTQRKQRVDQALCDPGDRKYGAALVRDQCDEKGSRTGGL